MAGTASPGRPGGARRASRSVRLSRREQRQLRRATAHGGRRALRRSDQPPGAPSADERARGGRRARRPSERRTHGLPGTLGLTFLTAVVPGTGYLDTPSGGSPGGSSSSAGLLVFAGVGWYFGRDLDLAAARTRAVDLAFDPTVLRIVAVVAGVLLLVWLFVVWTSYRLVRPKERPRWHTLVGNVAVVVICMLVAAPVVRAAQYALATADFVTVVFDDNEVATTPDDATEEDPFAGRERVNVLLLGGDGGEGRDGRRDRQA